MLRRNRIFIKIWNSEQKMILQIKKWHSEQKITFGYTFIKIPSKYEFFSEQKLTLWTKSDITSKNWHYEQNLTLRAKIDIAKQKLTFQSIKWHYETKIEILVGGGTKRVYTVSLKRVPCSDLINAGRWKGGSYREHWILKEISRFCQF